MSEREVRITSSVGLHARPAAKFVKAAAASGTAVTIRKRSGQPVDAASMLAVLTLDIGCGEDVVLSGSDDAVLDQLSALLASAE